MYELTRAYFLGNRATVAMHHVVTESNKIILPTVTHYIAGKGELVTLASMEAS